MTTSFAKPASRFWQRWNNLGAEDRRNILSPLTWNGLDGQPTRYSKEDIEFLIQAESGQINGTNRELIEERIRRYREAARTSAERK